MRTYEAVVEHKNFADYKLIIPLPIVKSNDGITGIILKWLSVLGIDASVSGFDETDVKIHFKDAYKDKHHYTIVKTNTSIEITLIRPVDNYVIMEIVDKIVKNNDD